MHALRERSRGLKRQHPTTAPSRWNNTSHPRLFLHLLVPEALHRAVRCSFASSREEREKGTVVEDFGQVMRQDGDDLYASLAVYYILLLELVRAFELLSF